MNRGRREDRELWERVKKTVEPLHPERSGPDFGQMLQKSAIPQRPAAPLKAPASTKPVWTPAMTGTKVNKPQRDIEPGLRRRIERGRVLIDDRIDLHGLNQLEAHYRLLRFLHRAYDQGYRTILVITGKGIGGEGILKNAVPRWLEEPEFRKFVSGFSTAHIGHGGSGALYLRLRTNGK